MANSVTMDRVLKNRKMPRKIAPRIPDPLAHGIKLYVDHLEVSRRDRLNIRGWLFHEKIPVASIMLEIDAGDRTHRRPCRIGAERMDVFETWGNPHAVHCGFSATKLPSAEGGAVRLVVTLTDGNEIAVPLATLRWHEAEGEWRDVEIYVNSPQFDFAGATFDQYFERRFVVEEGLGATLSVVRSSAPSLPPPLPEPVVIMVSVYRGAQYLPAFFQSLLMHTRSPHHLVLIDNGNTDGAISAYLRALAAAHDHVILVRIPVNNGYVSAMCEGIKHAPPGHLVTLNTDIVLPDYWLERLMWPIFLNPAVASTTPFTNAGTVCSFPTIGEDNPLYLGFGVERIDRMFRRVLPEEANIPIPSGVGFCMGMNRRAVEKAGWFDEAAFGRGYGEENDWCLRAEAFGYHNVHVANLFVYHKHGGIYLSEEKKALMANSLGVINERFPVYHNRVMDFLALDPFAPVRACVAFLIAAERAAAVDVIIDHALGGGSKVTREEISARLAEEGVPHIIVLPGAEGDAITLHLRAPGISHVFPDSAWDDLDALLARVRGRRLVVNNLGHWEEPLRLAARIDMLLTLRGLALDIMIHDFFLLCPSINLLDDHDRFCHLPAPEVCADCLPRNANIRPPAETAVPFTIAAWRGAMGNLLARADRVLCFSRSSAALVRRVFPALDNIIVSPHFLAHFLGAEPIVAAASPDLTLGVLGNLNVAKGSRIIRGLAAAIRRGGSRARLVLFGALAPETDPELKTEGVTSIPAYNHANIRALLIEAGVNMIFLPSIWPETFSFVAEEVMALGLPLATFDLGAPAERIRYYANGAILPFCEGKSLLNMLERVHAARAHA